jgi:hypothetical protein
MNITRTLVALATIKLAINGQAKPPVESAK